MAISPPGDIVLDVTRAADPAATALARARLEGKAGVASAEVAFEAAGDAPVAAPRLDGESASKGAVPKSYVKFEGMVLQTFLQSMMPNDTESVYGGGMSGDMWKSLLSQTLGETMAERGGIGIASHLMNDHYVENGKKVPLRGVDDSAGKKRTDTQDLLSSALVHELQRRTAQSLDRPEMAGRSDAAKPA